MEVQHPTKGAVRDSECYLPWTTRRAFGYVLLTKEPGQTIDGMIDDVLTEWLNKNHPNMIRFIEEQQEREAQFRSSLKSEKPF